MKPRQPMQPIVFTHIPKTAGSTVHGAMKSAFGEESCFVVNTNDDVVHLSKLSPERRNSFKYIGGHIEYSKAKTLFYRAQYVVTIRNPLHRVLSHYFFVIRHKGISKEIIEATNDDGLERFLELLYNDRGLANYQCRYLSGFADADAAVDTLYQSYSLAADVSKLANFMDEFPCLCQAKIESRQYEALNVAPLATDSRQFQSGSRPADYDAFLTPTQKERILAANREDMRLYEWIIREHNGLFINGKLNLKNIKADRF